MKYLILALMVPLVTGCFATSSDLRDLADDIRDETLSPSQIAFKIDEKAQAIEERAKHVAEGASGLTDPMTLVEILTAAGLAFVGTNLHRDRKARVRARSA